MNKLEPQKFTYSELAAAMVKARGIKEGRWTIGFEFGLGAMTTDDGKDNLYITAMVPIKSIVLIPTTEAGPNVVDAREISSGLILPPARFHGASGKEVA
jgi:hypothetical protein